MSGAIARQCLDNPTSEAAQLGPGTGARPILQTSKLLLATGTSAFGQELRGWFTCLERRKQLTDIGAEGGRETNKHDHSRVLDAALDPADMRPIDRRVHGKRLLRQSLADPYSPEISRDKLSDIHARKPTGCRLLNHGICSRIKSHCM